MDREVYRGSAWCKNFPHFYQSPVRQEKCESSGKRIWHVWRKGLGERGVLFGFHFQFPIPSSHSLSGGRGSLVGSVSRSRGFRNFKRDFNLVDLVSNSNLVLAQWADWEGGSEFRLVTDILTVISNEGRKAGHNIIAYCVALIKEMYSSAYSYSLHGIRSYRLHDKPERNLGVAGLISTNDKIFVSTFLYLYS